MSRPTWNPDWTPLLGTESDGALSRRLGVSVKMIRGARLRFGIATYLNGARPHRPLADRFMEKVHHEPMSGCWLWGGGVGHLGYGVIGVNPEGVSRGAHRVSWELHNGPIPAGLSVLHRCDNPPCVNPAHLFLGTASDNIQDCLRKGRYRSAWAKLDSAAIREAFELRAKGLSQSEIGCVLGVSRSAIQLLFAGKTWRRPWGRAA